MTQLSGSKVAITGAASGIGKLMAKRAISKGAQVAAWDRDEVALKELAAELETDDLATFTCDVTDRAGVFEVAEQTTKELGQVDILINNAGVVSGKPILELTESDIRTTFEVNSIALFWTTQALLPQMVERNDGHIVNIVSASAYAGVNKLTDYASSKWAAMGFNESLRVELRKQGSDVRTTAVCPFYIDTGMFKGAKSRYPKLLPILKEQEVADKTIEAIEKNKTRLNLPPNIGSLPSLRVLPTKAIDAISDRLGVNDSMDDFVGRD